MNFLRRHWFLLLVFGVVVLWGISFLWINNYFQGNLTASGLFGDTFGAVNSLFTALGLAGLVYTLVLQQSQIKSQEEDSKTARELAAKQLDLFAKQLEVYTKQLETMQESLKFQYDTKISESILDAERERKANAPSFIFSHYLFAPHQWIATVTNRGAAVDNLKLVTGHGEDVIPHFTGALMPNTSTQLIIRSERIKTDDQVPFDLTYTMKNGEQGKESFVWEKNGTIRSA